MTLIMHACKLVLNELVDFFMNLRNATRDNVTYKLVSSFHIIVLLYAVDLSSLKNDKGNMTS